MLGLEARRAGLYNMLNAPFNYFLCIQHFNIFNAHPKQFLAAITYHRAISIISFYNTTFRINNIKAIHRHAKNCLISRFLLLLRSNVFIGRTVFTIFGHGSSRLQPTFHFCRYVY